MTTTTDNCPPLVDVPTGARDADVECSNCCTPMDEPHTWRQCAEGLWKQLSAKCDADCDARLKILELEAELAKLKGTRMFPIQLESNAAPHPTQIPWSVAELAYSVYASRYGRDQSLERLAERGGFAPSEMDKFLPGWRARCDEAADIVKFRALAKRAATFAVGIAPDNLGTAVRAILDELAALHPDH